MLITTEQAERCEQLIYFLENETISESEALQMGDHKSEIFSLSHVCEVLSYGTIRDLSGLLHKVDTRVSVTGRMWFDVIDNAQVEAHRSGPLVLKESLGLPMDVCKAITNALDEFENLGTQKFYVLKALKRHLRLNGFLKDPMKSLGY
jgi:hypothetical protein